MPCHALPEEYVKKSELKVGDRASLNVKYGDHKGSEQCLQMLWSDALLLELAQVNMPCVSWG